MSTYPPVRDELARLLSRPRLDQYRKAVGGGLDDALLLYAWNLQVSAAFFESLHYLEVALRNTIDDALTGWATRTLRTTDPWYRSPVVPLTPGSPFLGRMGRNGNGLHAPRTAGCPGPRRGMILDTASAAARATAGSAQARCSAR